jgi:hypothetical protein
MSAVGAPVAARVSFFALGAFAVAVFTLVDKRSEVGPKQLQIRRRDAPMVPRGMQKILRAWLSPYLVAKQAIVRAAPPNKKGPLVAALPCS